MSKGRGGAAMTNIIGPEGPALSTPAHAVAVLAARFADWLHLAATPCFAVMALLNTDSDGRAMDAFCFAEHRDAALGGMVPMYLLMSAFHLAPWLRLIGARRRRTA